MDANEKFWAAVGVFILLGITATFTTHVRYARKLETACLVAGGFIGDRALIFPGDPSTATVCLTKDSTGVRVIPIVLK